MKGIPKFPKEYFLKYSTKPVDIKPFDPKIKGVAKQYARKLNRLISDFELKVMHRGATAFGISGKEDIEFGIYPDEDQWFMLLMHLINHFQKIDNLEENYARFNDKFRGYDIEIILMKGHDAKVDKCLIEYLLSHPRLLKQYEDVKEKYAYSGREYAIHKDKFLRKIIKLIPE
ncbi:GrpB family protein [Candidatus Dojkabacteria bacterium]|nr:GrpB family protein [Candidatus Dojkabacteria bacterium]